MRRAIGSAVALAHVALQAGAVRTANFDLEIALDAELVRGDPHGDIGALAVHAEQAVAKLNCDDFTHDFKGVLKRLQETFTTFNSLISGGSMGELRDKIFETVAEEFQADQLMVLAISETSYRKDCMDQLYHDDQVQAAIANLLDSELEGLLLRCDGESASTLGCREAYAKMVQWQHALLRFKEAGLFKPLMSTEIRGHCPDECSDCSREHRSKYKKNEPFKFKCYLKDASKLPTDDGHGHGHITCEKPKRRTFKFWQKKTWCEVLDWKKAYLRRNKLNALFGCSVLLMQPKVQAIGDETLQRAHRACMLAEQGIVVKREDWDVYESSFNATAIKTKSNFEESIRWATRSILNLGMMAGFSELIHQSSQSHHAPAPAPGDAHHSLLQGDPAGDPHHVADPAPAPPAGGHMSAIEVFVRGNPTTGGEAFFNEELENEVQDTVCHIEARAGQGILGIASQFFRQAVRLPLLAAGIVIHSPTALLLFFSLLTYSFEQNFFIGLGSLVASPLLLAHSILKVSGDVWVKAGRLLRIADWDCDPALVTGLGFKSQCVDGLYFHKERAVPVEIEGVITSSATLKCLPEYNGAMVYEIHG